LAISSAVKLTWKSRLKSVPCEDTHRNFQPMRLRKRSISASGARETATKLCRAAPGARAWVGVVGHVGAALAALLPARGEHEVLHHELAAAVEQVGQRARALGRVEDVVLVDAHPRQRAALARDLVAEAGQLLLARQQGLALGEPLLMGNDGMVQVGDHAVLQGCCRDKSGPGASEVGVTSVAGFGGVDLGGITVHGGHRLRGRWPRGHNDRACLR
jgi:hypothetical protein